MTLDQAREEYQHALRSTYVDRGEPDVGRTYNLVDEDAADALIAELEAEVERANELCIRELKQAEATIESLKCCGNCEYGSLEDCGFICICNGDVNAHDFCHFNPPLWKRREP